MQTGMLIVFNKTAPATFGRASPTRRASATMRPPARSLPLGAGGTGKNYNQRAGRTRKNCCSSRAVVSHRCNFRRAPVTQPDGGLGSSLMASDRRSVSGIFLPSHRHWKHLRASRNIVSTAGRIKTWKLCMAVSFGTTLRDSEDRWTSCLFNC